MNGFGVLISAAFGFVMGIVNVVFNANDIAEPGGPNALAYFAAGTIVCGFGLYALLFWERDSDG